MLREQMDLILCHLSFQMSLLHHDIIRVVCALGQGLKWLLLSTSWWSTFLPHPEMGWSGCEEHNQWIGTSPGQGGRQRQIFSNRRYLPAFKFFSDGLLRPSEKVSTKSSSFNCAESICLDFCMWIFWKNSLSPNLLPLPTFLWEVGRIEVH